MTTTSRGPVRRQPARSVHRPVRRGARPAVRLGRSALRLRAVLAVIALALLLVSGRLVQLQGVQAAAYATQATDQALRTETLVADRGEIVDDTGAVLAEDVDARTVTADPALITDAHAEAAVLAPLVDQRVAAVVAALTVPGQYSLLSTGLTPNQGDAVVRADLPGIYVTDQVHRVYPDGSLAGPIVGFEASPGSGIEYAENALLSGRNGRLTMEVDLTGKEIPSGYHREVPPLDGDTVTLTINRNIQWMAEQAIAAQVSATKAHSGMVVVLDPHTGAILAMASAPGFDPATPQLGSALEPAVADVYEPGSVNKIITAAGAIQDGVITPDSEVTVPPSIVVAGTTFHDAEPHGVEHLTFTGVLAESSNIGTIEVSQLLGANRLYHFLRAFGFGSATDAGIPGESPGLLVPPAQWSGTQFATIPFGQGMAVTALQVASVYATVANGGVRLQPHIIQSITTPSGAVIPQHLAAPVRVVSASTAEQVRTMLEAVTTDQGTAPLAAIPGYLVAGKTGTANSVGANGRYDGGFTASFVGMAPANDPAVVVEAVLDDPTTDIYGGGVAAPVFREVMGFCLQTLRVPPSGAKPPTLQIFASP